MAEGYTNARVAAQLHVSQSAVEKHINAMFDKPRLPRSPDYSRRVLAILGYLGT
jgi:DNA-binding NarL/FixJ family response regulator